MHFLEPSNRLQVSYRMARRALGEHIPRWSASAVNQKQRKGEKEEEKEVKTARGAVPHRLVARIPPKMPNVQNNVKNCADYADHNDWKAVFDLD